jgi:fructoselysine-6-P-deglycase FrlB-like protein
MTTPVFSEKLDSLPGTLDLLRDYDANGMAKALAAGAKRHALAIGSGGSAIAAEYLARCRETLGLGPTTVQTPMRAVLDESALTESDVWLFSAGGDNPDAVAACRAAFDRNAKSVHLVTRGQDGAAADLIRRTGGTVHVVPVADRKDGYLATHSILATMVGLLFACDMVSGEPSGAKRLLDVVSSRLVGMRDSFVRETRFSGLEGTSRGDTLLVVADTRLSAAALLLDTSVWEASLCHVQSTDFRNFAHGRHGWLHHRASETVLLALTGGDSESSWSAIDGLLPSSSRRIAMDYGACGRIENVLAAIDGLGLVEAMGAAVGIDPGKPGIGEFGRPIYEGRSLADLSAALPANVRHKRAAMAKADSWDGGSDPLHLVGEARLRILAGAEIGGVVMDYDGTVVTTAGRFGPPDSQIVEELIRLHGLGLRIGFATGRGGSAGEELRKVLPSEMLAAIPIGYYNGGHLRSADVDVDEDPAVADQAISDTAAWLRERGDLFADHNFKHRAVQITVEMDSLLHPYRFPADVRDCAAFADGRVRVTGSGHSYDITPAASSKLVVVQELRVGLPAGKEVLCFGDSGSRPGNDHALLSHPFGISVGDVCAAADGCWSMFGAHPIGPEALLRILRSLVASDAGGIRLDLASLGLDR